MFRPLIGQSGFVLRAGLELYIGPPRTPGDAGSQPAGAPAGASDPSPSNLVPGTQVQAPLTTFSWRTALPVHEWAHCSPKGYLSGPKKIAEAPAPVDLLDDDAFYGQMMGQSMLPEGVGGFGFYCLVSPNSRLDLDDRVWLRNRRGQEVVRRLVAVDGEAYSLRGWQPPDEHGHQDPIEERWMRAGVAREGAVLAVYAGWPSVRHPPFLVPDPGADPAGRRVVRVSAADRQLATLLISLAEHYDQLNKRGRGLLLAEMRQRLPGVLGGAETEPT